MCRIVSKCLESWFFSDELSWDRVLKQGKLELLKRAKSKLNRPGIPGDSKVWEYGVMSRANRYSPEVRERAVRLVREAQAEHSSQWAAIQSIAAKIGCTHETLRRWVRQSEKDLGERAGLSSDEKALLKQLQRENRELKQANEILRKASAFFAQAELDRRPK